MLGKLLPFGGSKETLVLFFVFVPPPTFFSSFWAAGHFLTTSYKVSILPPGSHMFLSAIASPGFGKDSYLGFARKSRLIFALSASPIMCHIPFDR